MATTVDQIATTYPIPTYRYRVAVGDQEMAFSAVSGLEVSYETIEYKDGTGGVFRMPGQSTPVHITLRRGMVVGKSQLYDWISSISLNQVEKKDISISLTNASGNELLVTWNISNAFPTKLSAPNFDASSNEVAIEELSLLADAVTSKFH
ncbi:phage tail-like protein [Pseudomonas fluorescens]|uniref:phage tail protein n=1 Tax=Pseudomonas fluorescens TaxID=294 RepID=UPI00209F8A4D|nr:phage tail protein [Pseudomonas fluorescens]MCP1489802.1 phage tail-like protein [Pseudomonas fluorescens]